MTTLTAPSSVPKTLDAWHESAAKTYGPLAKEMLATYPASTDAEVPNAWLAVARDSVFTWQMRTWARMMKNVSSDAYLYYFSHVPDLPNKEYLGAFHASEIMFVFNNVVPNEQRYNQKDTEVASYVSEYWVNFAKTGNPNGPGLPTWQPYNIKTEPYMELGDSPAPGNHLLKKKLDFMEKAKQAELVAGGGQ
jgi:para-nitrobenzyl esterase